MSTFSSLIVFYPGSPPRMTLREARSFCDRLREALSLGDVLLGVDVKYGESIDQDDDTTNKIEWDESGMMGQSVPFNWDHEKRKLPWPELWPGSAFDTRNLYRAYVGLGSLPHPISLELTSKRDEKTTYEYFVPDSLSFQIDPVFPATLSTEDLVGYGYIELAFAGNGYITWQPLSRYWEHVRTSPALLKVLQICRESFPVPRLANLGQLNRHLGSLFLNHEEYQQGDWIVSVSETG